MAQIINAEKQDYLTHEQLLDALAYDPVTGIFTRKQKRKFGPPIGTVAGGKKTRGGLEIAILGKRYEASRVAWFYVHGVWPERLVDHENQDRNDNRISNLRLANHSQNGANSTRNKSITGIKGVRLSRTQGKYEARITVEQQTKFLGTFSTKQAAHQAYCDASRLAFGEFAYAELEKE